MKVAITLLVFAALAEAAVAWNSSDAVQMRDQDEAELEKSRKEQTSMEASKTLADNLLKANQSILEIQQGVLEKKHTIKENHEHTMKQQKQKLTELQNEYAEEKQDFKSKAMQATNLENELKAARGREEDALQAEQEASTRKDNVQVELVELKNERDRATFSDVDALPGLVEKLGKKKEEEQKVNKTLEEAKANLTKAQLAANKLSKELDAAVTARDEADTAKATTLGAINATENLLSELTKKGADYEAIRSSIEAATEKQKKLVDGLRSDSKNKTEMWLEKKREVDKLVQTIKHDGKCINDLERKETLIGKKKAEFESEKASYDDAADEKNSKADELFAILWATQDELDEYNYKLNGIQIDCAPASKKPNKMSKPAVCSDATGGTCRFLGCKKKRNADCITSGIFGSANTCKCRPGWCSTDPDDGICEKRPSPSGNIESSDQDMPGVAIVGLRFVFASVFVGVAATVVTLASKRQSARSIITFQSALLG